MYRTILLLLVVMPACVMKSKPFLPMLDGCIMGSGPIRDAIIDVFAVNPETGEVDYSRLVGAAISDAQGCFTAEIDDLHPMLLVVGRSGYTDEYWGDETIKLRRSGHTFALIPYLQAPNSDHFDDVQPISMTPMTTLVVSLANARYNQGRHDYFKDAVDASHDLIYTHFIGDRTSDYICESRLSCLQPRRGGLELDEAYKYEFWLRSLSSQAYEVAEANSYSVREMNTIVLVDDLRLDVEADAVFDGMGSSELGDNALRGDLCRAVVKRQITPGNGFDIEDPGVRRMLKRVAENKEYELFGSTPISHCDF